MASTNIPPAFLTPRFVPYRGNQTFCMDGLNWTWKPVPHPDSPLPAGHVDATPYFLNRGYYSDNQHAWTTPAARSRDDPHNETTAAPALRELSPTAQPLIMGYISIPDFSVVGELHYLRDACGYLMKSIRTGRCFIDFGGYLPNSISTEVERFRVAPWLCFGARNVDILDRIKPPMPQFGFPMGTFVDEDVQLDTKAISNKLTYNKPWRFMNKVSGFHPDNKCTRARPGKGDTTCTEILKRLIDEDKHIIWEKVFMNTTWNIGGDGRTLRMEGGSITYTFDQRPFGHQLAREPDLAMQTLLTRFGSLLERDLIAPDITDYFDDNQIEWDVDDDDDDDDEEEEVEASKREEAGQKMEPQVKSELSGEGQMSYHMGAISVSQQGFPYPDNIDEDIEAVLALDPVDWMLGTQQEYPSMPHTNSFTAQATQPGDTAVEEEAIMAKWLTFEGVKTEPDEAMAGGPSQTHSLIPTTTQGSDPSFPFLPTTAPTTGPPPTPAPPPPFLRLSDRTLPQLAHQLQPAVDHVNELIASMHYSTDHGYNHLCNIIKNKARDNWLASGGDPNSQGYLFGLDGIFALIELTW